MIRGVHAMFYTPAAEQVRAFLKDTMGFPASDVGGGWLIFDGPEVEVGVHPSEGETHHDISFYTDDVEAAVKELSAKGVEFSPITDQGYGLVTGFEMPGGVKVALYQPKYTKTGCEPGEPDSAQQRLKRLHGRLGALQAEMLELKKQTGKGPVEDYVLQTGEGTARLSELFGDKDDLIVIQNMGRGCPYCTMWADGFAGVAHHLEQRAALVVCSPDAPETQDGFKTSRGWPFRMVSSAGATFKQDLGFQDGESQMPGVSTFRKDGHKIINVANDFFGPGDTYCSVWHLFDLLEGGTGNFSPRLSYEPEPASAAS